MAEEQGNLFQYPMTTTTTTTSGHLNITDASATLFMRLESSSSMIKEEQQIYLDATLLTNPNATLRNLLKPTSLLNKEMESSGDALTELFSNDNKFTLDRWLSDFNGNELPFDMGELVKLDAMKNADNRSLLDFFACDSLEQMNAPATDNITNVTNQLECPLNEMKSTCSFIELRPPTPDFGNGELFEIDPNDLKLEFDSPLIFAEMNPLDQLIYTPSSSASVSTHFNFDSETLMNYEDPSDVSAQSTTLVNTPTPSPRTSKRTPARGARRTSSRLQSRAKMINFQDLLNNEDDDSCSSPTISERSSIASRRSKRCPSVSRVGDVKTEEDLSYYLERRRKNNEASKVSRAARKRKFDQMDFQCIDYERSNNELRLKLSTLEIVVASLKNGLIHSFRKDHS